MDEPKQKRAKRGSEQIDIRGRDPATGKPRIYARFTIHGRRYHVRLEATTTDEARAELVDRRRAALENRPYREAPKAAELTVRKLGELFCGKAKDFQEGAGAENRNPVDYRRQFWSVLKCHVFPHIGDLDAMAVRPKDVKAMKTALLDAKKSNRAVQRALNVVSRLFNWAVIDDELLDRDNPASRIKKPSPKSSTEFYSEDEITRLLAVSAEKMPGLYPLVTFAFYTGCRKGEIAALQWGDIDLEGGRIVVQRSWKTSARKSGKQVVIHIHPRLEEVLRDHRPKEPASSSLVFPDPQTGKMRDKFRTWGLRELAELAKVRRFKSPWHSFRHAQATSLAANGASLSEIRDALGQSTLQMAAQYAHLAASAVKARIHSLPDLGPAKVVSLNSHRKDIDRTKLVTRKNREARGSGESQEISVTSAVSPEGVEPSTNGLRGDKERE